MPRRRRPASICGTGGDLDEIALAAEQCIRAVQLGLHEARRRGVAGDWRPYFGACDVSAFVHHSLLLVRKKGSAELLILPFEHQIFAVHRPEGATATALAALIMGEGVEPISGPRVRHEAEQ